MESSEVDINCPQCKKNFKVKNYRINTAKYCSRSCKALFTRVQVKTNCELCGKYFEHISSRSNKAKYCSRQCYHKAQHLKGTKQYTCKHCSKQFLNPPSHKRVYCSRACVSKSNLEEWNPAFSTVRKSMVKRGMIKACIKCGYDKEPKILGVHHIDENRKNNELSNLMVLCPNCHSLEHLKHIAH